MAVPAAKGDEDALGRSREINGLDRVFNGVARDGATATAGPLANARGSARSHDRKGVHMAVPAAKGDEDALGGSRGINDLDRVFNGVVLNHRAP